ncbi:hypothetical protein D3C81_1209070 [compost metagenome]
MVGFSRFQAAWVDRLVVTGDQAVGVVFGRTQPIDLQVLLQESAYLQGIVGHVGSGLAGGGPDRITLELFAAIAPRVEAGYQVGVADAGQVLPGGIGVGGNGMGFRLGVLAAVAAGQQGQRRECPGQVAQGRFHEWIPVMDEHEASPLFFVWLLVFGPWAAILAAHFVGRRDRDVQAIDRCSARSPCPECL